ncbi:MAG: aspartyl protease family protein [Alphaproteobacteria bacterium]|nr:aspartyl protease family protein [Alphaproteobacteria bacterium]MBV9694140.1 aspartyl protease family protein [Alphaproteobacteria bacterium]
MRKLGALVVLAFAVFCGGALAEDPTPAPAPQSPPEKICQLSQAGSLDLKTSGTGMVFLDADLDGHKGRFLVDTGGLGLVLSSSVAQHLQGDLHRTAFGVRMVGGVDLDVEIAAKRLQIANFAITAPRFIIVRYDTVPLEEMGIIQPHALWPSYDIELDFVKGKLNLFLPDQCPGHVVYWTHDAYASVPMQADLFGHLTVQAQLDGNTIDTLLDTGAQTSTASLRSVSHNLDIDERTQGMKAAGSINFNGNVEAKRYRYPFKTLSFEGLTIYNPNIEIADTGNDSRHDPLVLGIGVLRQLHLFIAYDEDRVYLTPAEAH